MLGMVTLSSKSQSSAGGVRNLHQLSEVTSSDNFPQKIKSRAKKILRGENSSELVKPRTTA